MTNLKATLYIIGFFSLIIAGAVGTSVYVLHGKQAAQGTLSSSDSSLQAVLDEEALKNSSEAPISSVPQVATTTKDTKVITNSLSEVAKHNSKTNCWLVISSKIYDVSSFLGSHPGGVSTITPFCGKDATTAFKTHGMAGGSNHSSYAYSLLPTYYVGVLNAIATKPSVTTTNTTPKTTTPTTPTTPKVTPQVVVPKPTTPVPVTQVASGVTVAEVATHNSQSNCWIIISGKVYNVTSFMASHPGGVSAIANRCGTDATTVFTTSAGHTHSSYAYSLLPTYYVADVGTATVVVPNDTTAPTVPTGLTATAISESQINLSWTASTDANGVSGYKIYRGGTQVGTSGSTSYSDTGLSASTAYSYTVSAYDGSGNTSAQSTSKSATTNSAPVAVTPPPAGTTYTTAQVSTHNIQSDCWIIISGKVYNVTSFMASHPGGE
jgi:cytochrome b involved in lipid metabolism